MASIKEIRTHIKSVEQTLKITNAMYSISSSNLRKARKQLSDVEPYFYKIESTIADILCHSPAIEHRFFDQRHSIPADQRKTGYVIITGEKGLAGSYNHNILKLAEQSAGRYPKARLLIVGQVGRTYFANRGIAIAEDFAYTDQNPSIRQARDIAEKLIDLFVRGELDEVHVLYTHVVSALQLEPTSYQLLPLSRSGFPPEKGTEDGYHRDVVYLPSVEAVMAQLVPSYVQGVLFGALVESYCAEQHARMTAMQSSTDNARSMMQDLSLSLNRARQAAITQEITEVVGGAQASDR